MLGSGETNGNTFMGTAHDRFTVMAILTEYLHAAMRQAEYERLEEGGWYAHIPGLLGLWASARTVEDTRNDLLSALEDWLYVNAYVAHLELPQFDGISMAGLPPHVDS